MFWLTCVIIKSSLCPGYAKSAIAVGHGVCLPSDLDRLTLIQHSVDHLVLSTPLTNDHDQPEKDTIIQGYV